MILAVESKIIDEYFFQSSIHQILNELKSYRGEATEIIYAANEVPPHIAKFKAMKDVKGYRFPAPGYAILSLLRNGSMFIIYMEVISHLNI